ASQKIKPRIEALAKTPAKNLP
ncbi:hypothetical protein, partial [Listeria monocytogenes]